MERMLAEERESNLIVATLDALDSVVDDRVVVLTGEMLGTVEKSSVAAEECSPITAVRI